MTYQSGNRTIGSQMIPRLTMLELSEEQLKHYNAELERFFAQYQSYLQSIYTCLLFHSHCIELKFTVFNKETTPAEYIDLHFHFPDRFDVIEKKDFPAIANKPDPPYRPQHRLDIKMPNIGLNLAPLSAHHSSSATVSNSSLMGIQKTNSYDVKFHTRSIKHNKSEELKMPYLKYDNIQLAEGFSIDYNIFAGNVPKIVTGQLNVRFVV